MVPCQAKHGRRNQCGPPQKIYRIKYHLRRSLPPTLPRLIQNTSIRKLRQTFRRHRRPPGVPAEILQRDKAVKKKKVPDSTHIFVLWHTPPPECRKYLHFSEYASKSMQSLLYLMSMVKNHEKWHEKCRAPWQNDPSLIQAVFANDS